MVKGAPDKHFLVIEGDPEEASFIRRAFRAIPYCTSFLCRNASEARAYLTGAGLYADRGNFPRPDAILLELRLGSDSGAEFVQWLHRIEDHRDTPAIILAGSASEDEVSAAYEAGAKRVVIKPAEADACRKMFTDLASELCRGTALP